MDGSAGDISWYMSAPESEAAASSNGTAARPLTPAEFDALYRESFPTLWCIAVGMLADRALAEDVLQDAAMIALKKVTKFQRGSNFTAWLGRIVRFVALNTLRQRARAAALQDPADMDRSQAFRQSDRSSPIDQRGNLRGDQAEFDDQVLTGLKSLNRTARACLLLRTIQDMTYQEIALALNIPEGTAMSHVHRARQFLRARIAGPNENNDG